LKLPFSRQAGLFFTGIVIALALFFVNPFQLPPASGKVIAVGALMIFLWVSEAMPMAAVALFPLVLFPLFGIASMETTAASYANPVIFLFMGGFMLGLAIEKWNLHKRIALNIVQVTGTSGNRIVLGFIIATGLISMWLSNTATTMMMFPIALSVIHVVRENHPEQKGIANFSLTLMLAIAFASNFGGIATLIGTPPNVAYAAFIRTKYDYNIDFFKWMLVCTPLAVLLLLLLYLVMVKWLFPNNMANDSATRELIRNEVHKLGKFSGAEKKVLFIFSTTALLWITKDLINSIGIIRLDDTMIALIGGVSLFIFRSGDARNGALLDWEDTRKMAWGILLLFGGGIALAGALEKAGLIQQLGNWFAGFASGTLMLIFLVTLIALFLSEVMSNVAQVIVFAPVVSALAEAVHMHPLLLGIPMTLAASCASMLPMGTPPNAIVFSSGHIKLKQMTKVGFVMNVISVILITLFGWLVLPAIFKL
jgi:solute carrier family 13 (sodium-dependent dicarboxylate transporter), member 2/3/5